jgi:hypothetical protein
MALEIRRPPTLKPALLPFRQRSSFLPEHRDNRRISPYIGLLSRRSKGGAKPLVMGGAIEVGSDLA